MPDWRREPSILMALMLRAAATPAAGGNGKGGSMRRVMIPEIISF
jgi:hypothetical protein